MGSADTGFIIPSILLDSVDTAKACSKDEYGKRIDAIFGAYRDENGKNYVMPFVKKLEKQNLESPDWNHEYVIFTGLEKFTELVPRLVLGENSEALKSGRAFGIQTISGTGAIRAGAELLVRHAHLNTFYLSAPTWDNHEVLFLYAGFPNSCTYRYWDPVKKGLDFEGMIEDLQKAPENAVVVLQICAHNPTGVDLTKEQWMTLADVMEERKLFPFFDAAYQGLGSGNIEEDAWPMRYFVDRGFETFIAQTFSKNMGLYGYRTGGLTVVLKEEKKKEIPDYKLMLTVIVRALYLCPERHGADIVIETLEKPQVRKEWYDCLSNMVTRLNSVRKGLRERLEKLGTPGTWDHITRQTGMFSFIGISRKQVAYMANHHHIYILPNGRSNMCSFNEHNLDRFAAALHDTILNCK